MSKRIFSLLMMFCVLLSCILSVDLYTFQAKAAVTSVLADNVQDGQILQCWNWSFNNIKNNMSKIANQGFTAIQTSPVQASKESTNESWSTAGSAMWVYYQPISFSIETNYRSALGTKKEFKAMCDEAEKYGIKVIVDTIFNHLANAYSGNSINDQITGDIKNDSNCWYNVHENISNWGDRYDITHKSLGGLPDLNTSNSKIQNYAIGFLKECIDCGADGFRFDAAKHIETPKDKDGVKSNFWPNVLGAATSYAQSTKGFTPYYYGEVLDGTGGVDVTGYTDYMSITDNVSSNNIRNAVNSGNASSAANVRIINGAQNNRAVQWNESHDTYNDGSSDYVNETVLKKTWAIVGSRNEVCAMYLARPSSRNTRLGNADQTGWTHKEVKAVNIFKNRFAGQSESISTSNNILYNERGNSGVVLVNVNGGATSVSIDAKKMVNGTYKEQITGNTFTVSDGRISGNIGDTGIAVVYNEYQTPTQKPTEAPTQKPVEKCLVGDADLNGKIAIVDASAIQRYLADIDTFSEKAKKCADVDMSSKISITDATLVQQYLVDIIANGSKCGQYVEFSGDDVVVPTQPVTEPTEAPTTKPIVLGNYIYYKNNDNWGEVKVYYWNDNDTNMTSWPGIYMEPVGNNIYKAEIPENAKYVVFNNNNQGLQSQDITLVGMNKIYDNGTWTDYTG